MIRMSALACLPRLLVLPVLLALAAPAAMAQEMKQTGTIEISSTSVALGIGGSWGDGVLTLPDGSKHAFSIKGFDTLQVGIVSVNANGPVYNLIRLEDFPGNYTAYTGGITAGMGGDVTRMKNDKGVVIELVSTSAGVQLAISVRGITIKMDDGS